MYGFKPKSARGKTVPQLADGEKVKPRGFKGGGLILGPGTGTSDSIETEKRPGTFIMPADSTQAIGADALEELGEEAEGMERQGSAGDDAVPVALSNGEFEFTPEQVQALGEAVLTVMRDATHERAEDQQKAGPKAAGFAPAQVFADGGMVAPRRMDIGQWTQGMDQWRGEQAIADARQAKAFQDQADADQYAVQQAQREQQRQSFFNGGVVENNVTRDGNSYSGGNVGGSVSINGQAGAGTMSTVPAPVAAAPVPAASATPAATPGATPTAPPAATPGATPAAAPAAPMGWAERNAQRNNEVTASSIVDSPERRAAQAKLMPTPALAPIAAPATPAVGGIPSAATAMDATKPKPFGAQPTSPFGFKPRGYADGGTVQDEEERARRIAQIPVGGTMPAPPADGSGSSEFTRNVNNGLNALGGMGVVSSVPLRAGQAAKAAAAGSGATALPSGIPRLTGPAQAAAAPAADFVAGMGPGATTYANTIPRIGNAPTQALPAVNAALQEGAQANVLAAAARTAAGANAAAPDQPANPALAATAQAAPIPATPGGAVFGFYPQLAGGQRTTYATDAKLRTGVQATGPSTFVPAKPSEKTIVGGGDGKRMNAMQDPRSFIAGSGSAANAPGQNAAPGSDRGPASPPAAEANAPAPTNAQPTLGAGEVTAQNDAAARALSAVLSASAAPAGFQPGFVQAPIVRNSTNDWAARKALENMATAASSITNRPEWQSGSTTIAGSLKGHNGAGDPEGKVAAYKAALANDLALQQAQPNMEQAAMRENAANQRVAMQEQGSNTREAGRNALTAEELGLKREAQGFQTREAQQKEQLRNVLLDPKSTPEQRAVAQRNLAALSGKTAADRMQTVALPDTTNEMGQVVRGGQALVRVLEDGTVQQVPIGAQQGAALPPGMKRQIGTSNGRPVYEDMNGKQVIAKG